MTRIDTGDAPLVLLVENDPGAAGAAAAGLRFAGFDVDVQPTCRCRRVVLRHSYAALVVSLDLIEQEWLDTLQDIRRADKTLPIILLIDSVRPTELIPVLYAGACDFIRKPVDVDELVARLRLLLRNRGRPGREVLEFGGIRMDRVRHEVTVNGEVVGLTRKEYRLLECFLSRTEGVHTRQSLQDQVWGIGFDPGTNIVDVHIANLRRKLAVKRPAAAIVTVRGVGFRLTAAGR